MLLININKQIKYEKKKNWVAYSFRYCVLTLIQINALENKLLIRFFFFKMALSKFNLLFFIFIKNKVLFKGNELQLEKQ